MIQRRVDKWVNYNFPNRDPVEGLLGLLEEQGELSHHILKFRQNIREPNIDKIKDSIGDIIIYLCHYCILMATDFNTCWKKAFDSAAIKRGTIEHLFELSIIITELIVAHKGAKYRGHLVRRIIEELRGMCITNKWDLETVVLETWNSVEQRDWVKYPKNGRSE